MKPKQTIAQQNLQMQQAIAFHKSGKLAEAAAAYKKILLKSPKNTPALTGLGNIALHTGNLEECVSLLCKSLGIDPNQPATLSNRGVAFALLQRFEATPEGT